METRVHSSNVNFYLSYKMTITVFIYLTTYSMLFFLRKISSLNNNYHSICNSYRPTHNRTTCACLHRNLSKLIVWDLKWFYPLYTDSFKIWWSIITYCVDHFLTPMEVYLILDVCKIRADQGIKNYEARDRDFEASCCSHCYRQKYISIPYVYTIVYYLITIPSLLGWRSTN